MTHYVRLPCVQLKVLLGHRWRNRGDRCPGAPCWVSVEECKNPKWQRKPLGLRSTSHAEKQSISLVHTSEWAKPTARVDGGMGRELQVPACSAWDPAECSCHTALLPLPLRPQSPVRQGQQGCLNWAPTVGGNCLLHLLQTHKAEHTSEISEVS